MGQKKKTTSVSNDNIDRRMGAPKRDRYGNMVGLATPASGGPSEAGSSLGGVNLSRKTVGMGSSAFSGMGPNLREEETVEEGDTRRQMAKKRCYVSGKVATKACVGARPKPKKVGFGYRVLGAKKGVKFGQSGRLSHNRGRVGDVDKDVLMHDGTVTVEVLEYGEDETMPESPWTVVKREGSDDDGQWGQYDGSPSVKVEMESDWVDEDALMRATAKDVEGKSVDEDSLGPTALYPYLPASPSHLGDGGGPAIDPRIYGMPDHITGSKISYSCRPGGPYIYDILDTLPIAEYGVLSWEVIEREDKIFEQDSVKDEHKSILALWARWIFLPANRDKFVKDYLKGTNEFVKTYWRVIEKTAGWSALRFLLMTLLANRFLSGQDVAAVLVYYETLTGMGN